MQEYLAQVTFDNGDTFPFIEFWITKEEIDEAGQIAKSLWRKYHGIASAKRLTVRDITIDGSGEFTPCNYDSPQLVMR